MKKFFQNHPFVFAFFILIVSRIIGLGVVAIVNLFYPELNPIKDLGWLIQICFATTAVALVFWSGDAKGIGFTKPVSKKEWLLWVPPLMIPLYIAISFGYNVNEFSTALILLISALCVAVNEEVIFRGAFVKGFLRFGSNVTIFVPAILFGLIHIGNVFGGGDMTFAIFQIMWAIAGGIALTALRLRNGSLYPVITFHFILDTVEYFATGENGVHQEGFATSQLVTFLSLNILFAIYAVFVFKKSGYKTTGTTIAG